MNKLFILCITAAATITLSGCLGGGGGSGSTSSSGVISDIAAGNPITNGGNGVTGGETPNETYTDNNIGKTTHNPEPATIILLGSGLLGMAIAKRKKRLHRS